MPFRSGVSTVAPMYPTVLHIGYVGEREFETNIDLFKGAKIFAGLKGSASRMMFDQYTAQNLCQGNGGNRVLLNRRTRQ